MTWFTLQSKYSITKPVVKKVSLLDLFRRQSILNVPQLLTNALMNKGFRLWFQTEQVFTSSQWLETKHFIFMQINVTPSLLPLKQKRKRRQ